jgi:hypothetical protein
MAGLGAPSAGLGALALMNDRIAPTATGVHIGRPSCRRMAQRDLSGPFGGHQWRGVHDGDHTFEVIRTRRPVDHRSRAWRWLDAVAELTELQAQYAAWLDALPDNLQDSATADALRALCELDLTDLQAIDPPRGFGRD